MSCTPIDYNFEFAGHVVTPPPVFEDEGKPETPLGRKVSLGRKCLFSLAR
jgi:hypothetical protein